MNKRRRIALGEAADWCGIDHDQASAHRALYDARMTADIFCSMAAGEFVEHRARVMEELHHKSAACSVNLGTQCDGLADLLAKLRQQENNRAA